MILVQVMRVSVKALAMRVIHPMQMFLCRPSSTRDQVWLPELEIVTGNENKFISVLSYLHI